MGSSVINQTLPSFDEMVELAEANPQAFDQFKKEMCEEMILSASDVMQGRLWAQQSHIDLVISQCKNPTQANITLMQELSMQVFRFQDALEGDEHDPRQRAEVISFAEQIKKGG